MRTEPSAIKANLQQLIHKGSAGLPLREKKRVVLTNQITLTFMALLTFHASLLLLLHPDPYLFITNAIAFLLSLSVFQLNLMRRFKIARLAILAIANFSVFPWCLRLGHDASPHLYYFTLAVAPILFLSSTQRWSLFACSATSVAFFWIMDFARERLPTSALTPQAAFVFHTVAILLSFVALLSAGYYFYSGNLQAETELESERHRVEVERQRSDVLLLNILPAPVASRLKAGEHPIADQLDDVTVLFADVVNFTPLASKMPADELVALLNRIFSAFDILTEKHGLEKIKTIGDAYMVAGGILGPGPDHPLKMMEMSLEMLNVVEDVAREKGLDLSLRIGVHCGPVVAGVIGDKKFAYDIWGDTVNIAARLESQGVPNHIHISGEVMRRVSASFECTPRGTIELKGRGQLDTFFLVGRKHF